MNRSLLAAAGLAAAVSVSAQPAPPRLTPVVVSGDRVPESSAALPSSVAALDAPDLRAEGISDLRSALSEAPGLAVVGTGAAGAQTSVFLRGANSDQTLFVVDGVRLNTPEDSYANFLGAADLGGLARLEVLRGPQSTLYGSSAMGGVILLETAHGGVARAADLSAEAGSFRTLRGSAEASGVAGGVGYSFAAGRVSTDNDRPYNAFQAWNYSTRLEGRPAPWLLAGATFRGLDSHYEEPGATPTAYPDEGAVASGAHLGTLYVEADAAAALQSRLTAAWYQDEYSYDDGSPYGFYRSRNTRRILEWQNTWTPARSLQLIAGADGEWSRNVAGPGLSDRLAAGYVLGVWRPLPELELTAGGRHDDFSAEGAASTGRLGLAYRTPGGGPTWRATYGSGFEAPTPGERFGTPPYLLPNPGVRPERSRGWDAGLDQTLAAGRVRIAATVFANRFTDLLEYEIVDFTTYAGEEINVDRASTRGAEFSLAGDVSAWATVRGAYTYLQAKDDITSERLLRRPRHAGSAAVELRPAPGLTAGIGMRFVGDRVDGIGSPAALGGYATWRAFARWALPGAAANLSLTLRVENALNRRYAETAGYPALPRGWYGGVEWRR